MPTKLTADDRAIMGADPSIAKAMAEGFTLKEIASPRNVYRRFGTKISMAQHRYGKASQEAQDEIDESNRLGVILTTARAAYNRILREKPKPKPKPKPRPKATATGEAIWQPEWSKKPMAKWRELQNTPPEWRVNKVVLAYFGEGRQEMRVFAPLTADAREAVRQLTGKRGQHLIRHEGSRHHFVLRGAQYEQAAGG